MCFSKYLPTELINHIFSCLRAQHGGDRFLVTATLWSACLASRRLYEIAQPHLYATIRLDHYTLQDEHLTSTLRAKPHLLIHVKELLITQNNYGMQLREFLEEFIPSLKNLTTFRTPSRSCTSHLINALFFKVGSGTDMKVTSDFSQLRSLEVYAGTMIYRYHHILQLPRLEEVCLRWFEIVPEEWDDDPGPSNGDWGWASTSIKKLILRPRAIRRTRRSWYRARSLQALAKSVPQLETLMMQPEGELLHSDHVLCLRLFFESNTPHSLRRLELRDRQKDAVTSPLIFSLNFSSQAYTLLFEDIAALDIEELAVDDHLFLQFFPDSHLFDRAVVPASIRHLSIRHRDIRACDVAIRACERMMRMWKLSGQDIVVVVSKIRRSFPLLETLRFELVLPARVDGGTLRAYETAFADVGVEFCAEHVSAALSCREDDLLFFL